jgi:hypothetical protein
VTLLAFRVMTRTLPRARVAALAVVAAAFAAAGCAATATSSPPPPTTAAPATTQAAATQPATTSAPAVPQYTTSQQQAIDAAESYLAGGQGFSKAGLIQQLSSQYGNGFSAADATFAVDHVKVDWYQQAVTAAKGYMTSQPGWSCAGLVGQLDSPYGGQFTRGQAEYAARDVGLGSC